MFISCEAISLEKVAILITRLSCVATRRPSESGICGPAVSSAAQGDSEKKKRAGSIAATAIIIILYFFT
jgi:hypothetical protein